MTAALADHDFGDERKSASDFGASLRLGHWLANDQRSRRANVDGTEMPQGGGAPVSSGAGLCIVFTQEYVSRAMRTLKAPLTLLLISICVPLYAADLLLTNVRVYDGTGRPSFPADVRIRGNRIARLGAHLPPATGETVLDEHGLALAPGFIDMHSHGNDGLLEDLDAATISRQGVTTILVGQDGESNYPLADFYAKLESTPAAINVASMIGHATLREQAMGKDLFRPSSPRELAQMKSLLAQELKAGAFGLSTGLEYEKGHFATTEEVVELSKVAAAAGGFYISHVRDEADKATLPTSSSLTPQL
jgi:N-acyl-D-aspartate/D-glutamate deacylase